MNISLPQEFISDMKKLLGDEAKNLFDEYKKPPYKGLRVNTLKCTAQKLETVFFGKIQKNPFAENGYYLDNSVQSIGTTPLHHAGAFYVQEPSAMSAVTLLDVKENDKVLDLCAAPGGKSTQIAARLNGTGLLWSNEIIKSRANILLSNIERCGVKNAVVSSETPKRLCDELAGYFDKVLVDAPCSGEGMFRKDNDAIGEWSRSNVLLCKSRQLEILDCAAKALKEGGELVYSTCTFSYEENEEVTAEFLRRHSDFISVESGEKFGRKTDNNGLRIFPMDGGEGHYAVKLKRVGENPYHTPEFNFLSLNTRELTAIKKDIFTLYEGIVKKPQDCCFMLQRDNILILPQIMPSFSGLNILRAGVLFAQQKKNRLEPHHSFFMSLSPSEARQCVDYSSDSAEIKAFLHGEETECDEKLKGYCLVAVDGVSTGFAKAVNGRLKNKYPKGLRNN
ncbi:MULTISPECIES: RsmB/NOP family class I SAM-dependent RNA methyltransferase [unclassified Ruminococcus]|uniref:RsmB/NOP family class I SAM-dependent RNA methyltransferase n=1 Tax=unclassified Ruminococcus TaxID=2608920 RepID=UPI0021087F6C|nr:MULTISPECIES: RsmF rRNA methyltransferase first C-terminal domain-containing protein [unclassified Ruminococcus]MCQ4022690.1 NOL1/NOP2/sun family putative RNA methylase [Ruminococcus sp. zg-924]MCQ4114930.1 NOL1/NOP2/sun family putative RNA methylase [Ruminococcus sp. zg-921]